MKYLLLACLLPLSVEATPAKMAEALYYEGAKQPIQCLIKVANVIMTRVADPRWPDTITGVINQPLQFSYMNKGKPPTISNTPLYKVLSYISQSVISGEIPDTIDGANHYLNHNISSANWWRSMEFKGRCGDHWFYKY